MKRKADQFEVATVPSDATVARAYADADADAETGAVQPPTKRGPGLESHSDASPPRTDGNKDIGDEPGSASRTTEPSSTSNTDGTIPATFRDFEVLLLDIGESFPCLLRSSIIRVCDGCQEKEKGVGQGRKEEWVSRILASKSAQLSRFVSD